MLAQKNLDKLIIISTLSLSFASTGFADALSTPFKLKLSKESTQTLLGNVSQFNLPAGNFATDLPNQELTNPYAVSISGLHLSLSYAFKTPAPDTNLKEWTIGTSDIQAELVVDAIQASQVITQQSGGSTLQIRLNATCRDVHLKLAPDSTSLTARIGVGLQGNRTVYSLNQLDAAWTPAAWQITSLNCQGPEGFTDIVRENAAAQLESINPFLPAIRAQIEAQVNSSSGQSFSWTLQAPNDSAVSLTLVPDNVDTLGDGSALVSGEAKLNFSNLQGTSCERVIETPPATPARFDILALPVEALQTLIQCAYTRGNLKKSFTNEEFPAFQALLGKSKLIKVFVFPHLTKFGPDDEFRFDLALTDAPKFGPFSTDKAGRIQFNLSSDLQLRLFGPSPEGITHWLDFNTQVDGPAILSVKKGVLSFSQSSDSLEIETLWDPDYLYNYRPWRKVKTRLISGYLSSYLSDPGLSFTIPPLQAAGLFSLSIDSVSLEGKDAQISVGIKKEKP